MPPEKQTPETPDVMVGITDMGVAFCEWDESRPKITGNWKQDARHYGELAAFAAGWRAREKHGNEPTGI